MPKITIFLVFMNKTQILLFALATTRRGPWRHATAPLAPCWPAGLLGAGGCLQIIWHGGVGRFTTIHRHHQLPVACLLIRVFPPPLLSSFGF